MPNKAIGQAIGSRVWKNTDVKNRLDVIVKKFAMLKIGPSQSLDEVNLQIFTSWLDSESLYCKLLYF
jgi:hypothetical protein